MDAVAKPYSYAIKYNLTNSNVKKINSEEGRFAQIKLELLIPYHLRYGAANFDGVSFHQLDQNFDVMSNCFKDLEQEELNFDQRWLNRFVEIGELSGIGLNQYNDKILF